MHTLMIGEPYPGELVLEDGMAVSASSGRLDIVVHLNEFQEADMEGTHSDVEAFRGPMTISAVAFETMPFVVVEFPLTRLVFDAPLFVPTEERLGFANMIADGGNVCIISAVEGPDYTVRVLRTIGLSHPLVASLSNGLFQPFSDEELLAMATRGRDSLGDPAEMIARALCSQTFEWKQ